MRQVIRLLVWLAYVLAIVAGQGLGHMASTVRGSFGGGAMWVSDAISTEVQKDQSARERLAEIVPRIQKADYEDDRSALRRLYQDLQPYLDDKELASRVRYWRGFALWRRALNGFNDKADVREQEEDLKGCVSEFELAAGKDTAFIDARVGSLSCLVGLFYLNPGNAERRQEYLKRFGELQTEAKTSATENPRVLWMLGGGTWYVPVERGGGQAKALEIYATGLQSARRKKGNSSDPLDPSWGEPELLMNLAWSNLNLAAPDLDAAEKNARAALALVPNWHYVRDILLPQILEARAKRSASYPSPGPNPPQVQVCTKNALSF